MVQLRLVRAFAIAVVAALALALPGRAAAFVGGAPAQCVVAVAPDCLIKGGGAVTTVSPKLVRVGDVLTVTLTANDGYGGPAAPGKPRSQAEAAPHLPTGAA